MCSFIISQMQKCLRQKQEKFKMDIRKQRLDAFIAEKRFQNDNAIRILNMAPVLSHESQHHLLSQPTTLPKTNLDQTILYLKQFPTNPQPSISLCSSILWGSIQNQEQVCVQFLNILIVYSRLGNHVALKTLCDWISQQQCCVYVFINSLFKEILPLDTMSPVGSLNVQIFKFLVQQTVHLVSDDKYFLQSYQLLQTLLRHWTTSRDIMYLIFVVNQLKQGVSQQSLQLLVDVGTEHLLALNQQLKSETLSADNKFVIGTVFQFLFYEDDIVETMMLLGMDETINTMLADKTLVTFGLACLEGALLAEDENSSQIVRESGFLKKLQQLVQYYLYNQWITDKKTELGIFKCLLSLGTSRQIQFDILKFIPVCLTRLIDPALSLEVLTIIRKYIDDIPFSLLDFHSIDQALEKILQDESHEYAAMTARQILDIIKFRRVVQDA